MSAGTSAPGRDGGHESVPPSLSPRRRGRDQLIIWLHRSRLDALRCANRRDLCPPASTLSHCFRRQRDCHCATELAAELGPAEGCGRSNCWCRSLIHRGRLTRHLRLPPLPSPRPAAPARDAHGRRTVVTALCLDGFPTHTRVLRSPRCERMAAPLQAPSRLARAAHVHNVMSFHTTFEYEVFEFTLRTCTCLHAHAVAIACACAASSDRHRKGKRANIP